ARAFDALHGGRDEVRVDADRRDGGNARVAWVGSDRLRRKGGDLAGRVLPFQSGQVHHPDSQVKREDLGLALDRTLGEGRSTLLERDGVDGTDARQPRLERELETARQNWCLRHASSVAPCRLLLLHRLTCTPADVTARTPAGFAAETRQASREPT